MRLNVAQSLSHLISRGGNASSTSRLRGNKNDFFHLKGADMLANKPADRTMTQVDSDEKFFEGEQVWIVFYNVAVIVPK